MANRKRVSTLVAVCTMACGTLARTEEPERPDPPLRLGSLVRVQTETASEPLEGFLVGIDEHALKLGTIAWSSSVPVDSITNAEVRVGRRREVLKGLAIGAGLGFLVSQAWRVDPRLCDGDSRYYCSRGEAVLTGLAVYGAIGAGTGALFKKDRWAPVDVRAGIERARAALPPAPGLAALPSQPEPLRPGPGSLEAPCSGIVAADRVRVIAPDVFDKPVIGYLVGSDAATLKVVYVGQTLSLPRESVTRLERSTRRSRRVLGMKIGAGIGVAAGLGTGIALNPAASDRGPGTHHGNGFAAMFLGYIGAFPGALLGAAIAPGERWVTEDPTRVCVERTATEDPKAPRRVRVGIAPAPGGGVGLRLSVAF